MYPSCLANCEDNPSLQLFFKQLCLKLPIIFTVLLIFLCLQFEAVARRLFFPYLHIFTAALLKLLQRLGLFMFPCEKKNTH